MKKKITALLVILAIMAAVPTVLNINGLKYKSEISKNKIITSIAANNFRKHYHKETIKAIILILNSNYYAKQLDTNDVISKKDFIFKYKKGEHYYSEIENTVKKMNNETVRIKNRTIYLPYFRISKGFTEESKKYPYLKACACPWDTMKKDFKNSDNTVGISINSIDKLCWKGLNYKEAIQRFLKSSVKMPP